MLTSGGWDLTLHVQTFFLSATHHWLCFFTIKCFVSFLLSKLLIKWHRLLYYVAPFTFLMVDQPQSFLFFRVVYFFSVCTHSCSFPFGKVYFTLVKFSMITWGPSNRCLFFALAKCGTLQRIKDSQESTHKLSFHKHNDIYTVHIVYLPPNPNLSPFLPFLINII